MAEPQELLIEIDEDEQNLDIDINEEQGLDIELDYTVVPVLNPRILSDTTAHWAQFPTYVAEKDVIYVYTDYRTIDGKATPGIKIGDGTSFLIDMPFVTGNTKELYDHINNEFVHVTFTEKRLWNNKVTCYVSPVDPERLIFTKAEEE